ncbi:MAG: hypothetical protein FWH22_02280 [Fibromonadales bacterium]|nr:hypothetical protein [Fibromonadales bacterium]
MDEKLYNAIKEKYGKHASWAVWGSDFKVPSYKEIAGKLKPNIVFVGLNPPSGIVIPFSNYHWTYKNGNPGNDEKLKYAFEDTKFEGAYMTDIIKLDAIQDEKNGKYHKFVKFLITEREKKWFATLYKNLNKKQRKDVKLINSLKILKKISEPIDFKKLFEQKDFEESLEKLLSKSDVIMKFLEYDNNVEKESVEKFKKELKDIKSENPLIIALGDAVDEILSRNNFNLEYIYIKIPHHSRRFSYCSDTKSRYSDTKELYKEDVEKKIKEQRNGVKD